MFASTISLLLAKYEQLQSNYIIASKCIKDIISTDYGKGKAFSKSEECTIFRGTDINEIKNGQLANPPKRFILSRKLKEKTITENDILIEVSGGAPTQSTGRCCFVSKRMLEIYGVKASTAGFSRIIRCYDEKDALSLYISLTKAYKEDFFFSYENGSNGIKNLKLKVALNSLLIKKLSKFDFINLKSIFDISQEEYRKQNNLMKIKDLLLAKYF